MFRIVLILSIIYSGITFASDHNELGAAKSLYDKRCSACHGDKAQGNDVLGSPSLTGQSESYILRQLKNFSTGVRGGEGSAPYSQQMAAQVSFKLGLGMTFLIRQV